MENLDIVDLNDNVIWTNTRHESYKNFTTNRVVSVLIFNNNWEIALQRRSLTCSYMPWWWWLSAWWHVSSWENYLESAKRELKEEIWVVCDLKFKEKIFWNRKEWDEKYWLNPKPSQKDHYFFEEIFEWNYNWEFKFDDWEVDQVKFFSISEIKEKIEKNEIIVTNWCRFILEKYYF